MATKYYGALLQVVAGGVDSMLRDAAPSELAQLRDAVLSLVAEPRETEGVTLPVLICSRDYVKL